MDESHQRTLIAAYFLSRFDRKGVKALGYESFSEAFEKIGEAMGVKPATVKHMRDSFDPYCSQVRVGWYQRKILPSRANVIQAYSETSEAGMLEIVRELLTGSQAATEIYTAPILRVSSNIDLLEEDNAFANRLRTGEKAEEYFIQRFPELSMFQGRKLDDTRKLGIGFDFRATLSDSYYAIEVKGLREATGSISFTDKEWSVAHILEDTFVLALVRSVGSQPSLELIPNPTRHIEVTMKTIESVSVYWNARF